MSVVLRRTWFVIFWLSAWLIAIDAHAQNQSDGGPDPSAVRMRIGPLGVTPRLDLNNLGIDTNVFNEPDEANPKEDFTFTATPAVDVWLRLGRSWLQTTVREELVWFQQYDSERSANTSVAVNWRMRLNRLFVTINPDYVNTHDRPGYEIDARVRRDEYGAKGNVEVRAFAKTFLSVTGSWRKIDYDDAAVFQGTSLAFQLNRTMSGGGAALKYQWTPLTSVAVTAERTQDRFEFSPLRDSDSTKIVGSISLDPQALLKGSASFGYRDFRPLVSSLPGYQGSTALGDLSYVLLGSTRFAVTFKRDIEYSYDINQPYYLETGFNASIAQQVFGPVDFIVRFGASNLAYRDRAGAAVAASNRVDHYRTYGGGVGYHLSPDLRLGFNVDHYRRTSELDGRRYSGLRYGTSVTYGQ